MITYHFTKAAGSTVRHPFWMQNMDKSPVIMTGWTARMMLRKRYSDKAPALTLTTENLGIEFAPLEGKFTIIITDAQMTALAVDHAPAKYVYDFEAILPNGDIDQILRGTFTVLPEATKLTTV